LALTDLRDLSRAISRCRRLLDLDADPVAVDDLLAADPVLAPHVRRDPGRRVPRTVDGAELAVRTVVGQQMSTAAARTHIARLVAEHGDPVADAGGGLTHLFPLPTTLAALDPDRFGLPRGRRESLVALVSALAGGAIDLGVGADRERARARLAVLPGFGRWTVETIAMRALGDPDAFLACDIGVRAAARTLGLPFTPATLAAHAAAWRPWRAYAVQYLWSVNELQVNNQPA